MSRPHRLLERELLLVMMCRKKKGNLKIKNVTKHSVTITLVLFKD